MIQYLLPPTGKFYRANLHAHSADSDGKLAPDALVKLYKDAGYSILAITDR